VCSRDDTLLGVKLGSAWGEEIDTINMKWLKLHNNVAATSTVQPRLSQP